MVVFRRSIRVTEYVFDIVNLAQVAVLSIETECSVQSLYLYVYVIVILALSKDTSVYVTS